MSLEILATAPSTMDVARARLLAGRVTFDVAGIPSEEGVMVREQTAGRGQRGRVWYAPPDESLCATYYFRHGLAAPEHSARCALLIGVAVADAVGTVGVGLKWPNDILLNGRKLGGILIEMLQAPDGGWAALVGVGINVRVRAFPPELAGFATSLLLEGAQEERARKEGARKEGAQDEGGQTISPQALGERIGLALRQTAARCHRMGFAAIRRQWQRLDQTPGRRYVTEVEGAAVTGTAQGVDAEGALQLRLEDGRLVTVRAASALREIEPCPRSP